MREAAIRSFFAVFALEGTNDVTVDARRSRSNEGLFEDGEDGGARRRQKGEGEKNPYGAGGRTEMATRLDSDSIYIGFPTSIGG